MSLQAFSEDIHSLYTCLCFAYIEESSIHNRLRSRETDYCKWRITTQ
jgi:hypothetical protein